MLDRSAHPDHQRAGRRLRQRRYRRRQHDGKVAVTIEVDGEMIELLTRTRWLTEAEADDRAAIGRALAAMLTDAARR
jgi:hypothetical protein